MGYRVKTVADMLGVSRSTLIAWERRLGVVDPSRGEGGYREYSDADVALLRRLRDLVDSGLKVSEAWSVLQQDAAASPMLLAEPDADVGDGDPVHRMQTSIRVALERFDRDAADAAASALMIMPFEAQLERVLVPLLRDTGERWADGRLSIAQEHFISGWCRERMMLMLQSVRVHAGAEQIGLGGGQEVSCCTPPGEQHELGLLALAIRLSLVGCRVTWLGASVPAAELGRHAELRRPAGICVSMVQDRPVEEILAYAREIRRRIPADIPIAIGGRAIAALAEGDWEVPGVTFSAWQLPAWLERRGRWEKAG